ncbi:TPA: hypothetical protein ACX6S2_003433 [Photobacterium damselae]
MNKSSVPFVAYTAEQKKAWAKNRASKNAELLSQVLGFHVNERLPHVLLQAAADVICSIANRNILNTHICDRADHYVNTMKVLATAILHYDLASNLVGTRDKSGQLDRCENSLFVDLLQMPSRTVDNCIYSLKRSGLYLSFEQREERDSETGVVYRGVASIKRLNMVLFEKLGLGKFVSIQRAKAKQRIQMKRYQQTPAEKMLSDYRKTDDKVRERRNKQRSAAAERRRCALSSCQKQNRTQAILELMSTGLGYNEIKDRFTRDEDDDLSHIPY